MSEGIEQVAPPAKKKPAKKATRPEAPQPHDGLDLALENAEGDSDLLRDLPSPFRPRHLTEMIRKHCEAHGITGEPMAKFDAHKFLKEHGLPNPTRLYRMLAFKGDTKLQIEEIEAVDESEATNLYIQKHIPKDAHQWKFRHFLLAY